MSIGHNLKKLREALGVTQIEFADNLGVSRYSITNYEREDSEPGTKFLTLLIDKYDVNINWLLTGEGSMTRSGLVDRVVDNEEKLRKIYPGIPNDPTIDDLVESLQVPIVAHAMLSIFILKRKEYREFITEYFEGKTDEEKTAAQG